MLDSGVIGVNRKPPQREGAFIPRFRKLFGRPTHTHTRDNRHYRRRVLTGVEICRRWRINRHLEPSFHNRQSSSRFRRTYCRISTIPAQSWILIHRQISRQTHYSFGHIYTKNRTTLLWHAREWSPDTLRSRRLEHSKSILRRTRSTPICG